MATDEPTDNTPNEGELALIAAACAGNLEEIRKLLSAGVSPNAITSVGSTALMAAVTAGQLEVTKALLAGGANPNVASPGGVTALFLAGDPKIVELLKSAGASGDLNLYESPADISRLAGYRGELSGLAVKSSKLEKELIEKLVEFVKSRGANEAGIARFQGYLDGLSFLDIAELVRNPVKLNAKIDEIVHGIQALLRAAKEGQLETVQALLAAKVEPNAQDSNGYTALMLSSFAGHQDVVKALLVANAKWDIENKLGDTALRLADLAEHAEIVGLLKSAGATK